MNSQRDGFTLIELLIVIVIIGLLASIAIPRLGSARQKAYFRAMVSDLRNLSTQQELYYTRPENNYAYATSISDIPSFQLSNGVTIDIVETSPSGWVATASHRSLGAEQCGIVVGHDVPVPAFITASGVVTCTGS